jgi:hypothetical protein
MGTPEKVGSFSPASLAADETAVYLWLRQTGRDGFGKGLLIAVDGATGHEKWRHTTSGDPVFEAVLRPPDLVVIPDNPPARNQRQQQRLHL